MEYSFPICRWKLSSIHHPRKLTFAVLASALIHGGLAISLAILPSNANTTAMPFDSTIYTISNSPGPIHSADKLLPGTTETPSTLARFAPATTNQFIVPMEANSQSQFGAALQSMPEISQQSAVSGGSQSSNFKGAESDGRAPATTFFGLPAYDQKVIYVIDRSASMGQRDALKTACREVLISIRRLPPSAQFQVIAYNSRPHILVGQKSELLLASADNLAAAADALERLALEPTGSTQHLPALTMALNLHPGVIYFLTDADELANASDLRDIAARNVNRAIINTIEFTCAHRDQPFMPMQVLARATGGSYQAIDLTTSR